MKCLNRSIAGAVLVVNSDMRLVGIATDGDIRRALLHSSTLDSPITQAMQSNPVVAPDSFSKNAVISLMQANSIRQLPIVDSEGHVTSIEFLEVSTDKKASMAVLMAGGQGQRLRPLTDKLPKPMLSVGDRPILETLIDSLKEFGFNRVFISVGYMREVIQDYFKDGTGFGIEIHYLAESEPLGTAGALGLIPKSLRPDSSFLVINGDVLTPLNFATFRDFHVAADYEFTLCCRSHPVKIPYGYPIVEKNLVVDFKEKPQFEYLVNSGIYCLSPALLNEIPQGEFFNMTDLIRHLCDTQRRVGVFPLREAFHEIGQIETYRDAEKFYEEHFIRNSG